jgi:hypothetical protein
VPTLSTVDFKRVHMNNVKLSRARYQGGAFTDVDFTNATLDGPGPWRSWPYGSSSGNPPRPAVLDPTWHGFRWS